MPITFNRKNGGRRVWHVIQNLEQMTYLTEKALPVAWLERKTPPTVMTGLGYELPTSDTAWPYVRMSHALIHEAI